jgi:hypothetical protein
MWQTPNVLGNKDLTGQFATSPARQELVSHFRESQIAAKSSNYLAA